MSIWDNIPDYAKVSVSQSYTCTRAEAKSRVMSAVMVLDSKYGLKPTWTSDTTAHFSGDGLAFAVGVALSTITIEASSVEIHLALGDLVAQKAEISADLTSSLTAWFPT